MSNCCTHVWVIHCCVTNYPRLLVQVQLSWVLWPSQDSTGRTPFPAYSHDCCQDWLPLQLWDSVSHGALWGLAQDLHCLLPCSPFHRAPYNVAACFMRPSKWEGNREFQWERELARWKSQPFGIKSCRWHPFTAITIMEVTGHLFTIVFYLLESNH